MTGPRWTRERLRALILGLLVLVVGYLLVSNVLSKLDANRSAGQAATAQAQATSAQQQATAVADPVAQLCAKNDDVAKALRERGACQAAQSVQESPAPGRPGVGIAAVTSGDCSLTIRLDDQRTYTLGQLCGAPGRGIAGATPDGCYIDVTWTDNSTPARLGSFCGATGTPGKDGKDGTNGTDGQAPPCMSEPTQCRGQDGKDGAPGPACPDGYQLGAARITAPDNSTYDGVGCIKPGSSQPPTTTSSSPLIPNRR